MSHAHDLAAAAFGADEAMFSTNGSTLSVQIAVVAATHPGQKVAVARNAHKSVVSGLVLSGAEPVYVDPVYMKTLAPWLERRLGRTTR